MYILHTYIYIFTTSVKKFRYILGVNEGSIEIEMTRPVPTKVIPLKRSRTTDQEMCFWLGTPYESEDVYILIYYLFSFKNANPYFTQYYRYIFLNTYIFLGPTTN